jgi:hypothetical protein
MLVLMSMPEPEIRPSRGFCFHCGTEIDGDILDHVANEHARLSDKPKASVKSWERRLDDIVKAIKQIRQESDKDIQIQKLDTDVIQELYLVRANLSQMKRRSAQTKKEG